MSKSIKERGGTGLLKIGGQPGPTGAPDWGIRFTYTLMFPTF